MNHKTWSNSGIATHSLISFSLNRLLPVAISYKVTEKETHDMSHSNHGCWSTSCHIYSMAEQLTFK